MSQGTSVDFRSRLMRWGTYAFLILITVVIVFSFGVADVFVSNVRRGDKAQFYKARVGSRYVTARDVKNYMDQLKANLPDVQPEMLSFYESFALDGAINQTMEVELAGMAGMFPSGEARTIVLARFYDQYKGNFSTAEGKFDFAAFEKALASQGINRTSFENDSAERYATYILNEMQRRVMLTSAAQTALSGELNALNYSFRVLPLTAADRRTLIAAWMPPDEKDIQARFEADYLSKDKTAVLTDVKRTAIIQAITDAKSSEYLKKLEEALRNRGLDSAAAVLKTKAVAFNKATAAKSLNELKAKTDSYDYSKLENSASYRQALFAGKEVQILNEGEDTFVMQVTDVALPAVTDYKAMTGKSDTPAALTGDALRIKSEIARKKIRIERYNSEG